MPDTIVSQIRDIAELLGAATDIPRDGDPALSLLVGIKKIVAEGSVGPGVFVREFNGKTGIGVSVDASGNPPAVAGNEGDHYFTLAYSPPPGEGLPVGWIIVPWEYVGGSWEFSSSLLPIAAKDLHWVAVKNGTDIEGYYVILSGTEEADLPVWELLGAAAVVPDKKTIGYNSAGEFEVIPPQYDINRPDLWSANAHIDLGNGLKGFRCVKSTTAPRTAWLEWWPQYFAPGAIGPIQNVGGFYSVDYGTYSARYKFNTGVGWQNSGAYPEFRTYSAMEQTISNGNEAAFRIKTVEPDAPISTDIWLTYLAV
jgi:hypothetical protein